MARNECIVTIKAGFNHARRSVAFLQYPSPHVDIEGAFNRLDKASERFHLKSFDMWMDDHHRPKRYHGWNKTEHKGKYTRCFVFKNVSEGERLYGFLCRPKEPTDPQYEMCVLVLYAQKKTWNTDTSELDRAEAMRIDPYVQAALIDLDLFEEGEGKHTWNT